MNRKRMNRYSMFSKTVAFILLFLSLVCVPIGVVGTYDAAQEGFYVLGKKTLKVNMLENVTEECALMMLYRAVNNSINYANEVADQYGVLYEVSDGFGNTLGNYVEGTSYIEAVTHHFEPYEAGRYYFKEITDYHIDVYILPRTQVNSISWACFVADYADVLAVGLPIMAVVGIIVCIGSFSYLMCAAGWKRGEEEVTSGVFGKIPTDIFVVVWVGLAIGLYNLFRGAIYNVQIVLIMLFAAGSFLLAISFLMSIAARIKAHTLITNTVIYKLWKWIVKLAKIMAKPIANIPLIWKTVVGILLISGVELLFLLGQQDGRIVSKVLPLWITEKIILAPFICYIALRLAELKIAGKKLAEGDLNHKVDTKNMFWDIKEHGESLNRISQGVNKAVNERMKSEHFKTELITNVSHDIKTPLTSIINYSDLLNKEESDNEKIKEYSDVIYRQSTRLKKLIEDLVDASKASTGNLEVNLVPCEVGVLLEQTVAEFEQKLYEKEIDVISKLPETPVKIMADGRHLWRVFDNLMNNICKYAQRGTRVYLTVEEKDSKAVITFKNISEYPLDITAEELMERFVRGDRSRHTDGNGLGLSIAKSLTELQDGALDLVVDGDLFKAILTFPQITIE